MKYLQLGSFILLTAATWRRQHTEGEDLCSLPTPTPHPPGSLQALEFSMPTLHFLVSLITHRKSLGPSPACFFLHSIPNCPFIIIFPPLESTGFLLKLRVGQRGGIYPERLTSPLASWVATSRALGKLPCPLKCSQPAQLLPDAQKEESPHQPLSQVENRTALSPLCALEGIIILF